MIGPFITITLSQREEIPVFFVFHFKFLGKSRFHSSQTISYS